MTDTLHEDRYTLMIILHVQVIVHRDNLRINNQQDAPSIQNFYFVTKLRSNLTLLGSGHITCMKHTNSHVYS